MDPALREYGTIMHDASVVNITAGNPGKFGEIEWSNKFSSSVSEMVANLLLSAEGDTKIDAEEATALLTGIVAATDRFSRANTASSTMQTASKLMDAGADQQLVAANISDDLDNQFFAFSDSHVKKDPEANAAANGVDDVAISFEPTKDQPDDDIPDDDTALKISHNENAEEISKDEASVETKAEPENGEEDKVAKEDTKEEASETISKEDQDLDQKNEPEKPEKPEEPEGSEPKPAEPEKSEDPTLLDELKATEASLSGVGAETVKEPDTAPQDLATTMSVAEAAIANASTPEVTATPATAPTITEVTPSAPAEEFTDATSKYSQMLTDALNGPATPAEPSNMTSALPPVVNPAATNAPEVSTPEVSGMPEINYGQTTGDILPPPPAPPIDVNSPMPVPAPSSMPPTTAPSEPAPTAPVDASAFTIPGM